MGLLGTDAEELACFERGAKIAEELAVAQALKAHAKGMQSPIYRNNYIADVTPDVRVCNATGHYTPTDLAVLFDLSVKDVTAILRGYG